MSLSFGGCVVWAIVESVAKADNWVTRFYVAIGLIYMCFMGLLSITVLYVIDNHALTVRVDASHPSDHPLDATFTHGAVFIPPLLLVDIDVDIESDVSDVGKTKSDGENESGKEIQS